jgi:putative ABC transport system permease protein
VSVAFFATLEPEHIVSLFRRLINLGRTTSIERDIHREMDFHIRERIDELRDQGLSEAEAMALAQRQFGNRSMTGEDTRDADVVTSLDTLRGDVRYAVRGMVRSPVFTVVTIASLALGIGANASIFTLIDAIVLRKLAAPEPHELTQVTTSSSDTVDAYFTNPLWEQLRDRQSGFTAIAAFGETQFDVSRGGEARRVPAEWVSGQYFAVFGMRAAVGRLLTPEDDRRGCPAVAVLSYAFWQSEFGGDPAVAGRTMLLDGKPFQIIGATTTGFTSPEIGHSPNVFVPICSEAYLYGRHSTLDNRSNWWIRVIGRRDPSIPVAQLKARTKSIAPPSYAATTPADWAVKHQAEFQTRTFSIRPIEHGLSAIRQQYRHPLFVLMGGVGILLLIASANVANLLLARAAAREREMAIRLAIGASRRRLVRQLLTESLLLAGIGAVLGIVVAQLGTRGLVALISTPSSPVALDLALNYRVLGFAALLATVTATLFGLAPALRATRVDPQTAMKANGRGVAGGRGRFTAARTLVSAQIALSLVLLVAAGLMVGSLRKLSTKDSGFDAGEVLLVRADLGRTGLTQDQRRILSAELLEGLRKLPGVQSASSADLTPLGGSSWNDIAYVEGRTPLRPEDDLLWFNEVTDQYFTTLGSRLLAGRDFDRSDVPTSPRVAVINEATAKKLFGDQSPLGRQFRTKRGDTFSDPVTVVGVVETAVYRDLRETESATIFLARSQNTEAVGSIRFQVRTNGAPLNTVPAVKQLFASANSSIILEFNTLARQIESTLRRERMLALLSGFFGSVALGLSILGLYGVMAYSVARRRNEIGVRMALGASASRVLKLVLADVSRMVTVGVVTGIAAAIWSGRLVASFLFGLQPVEPMIIASVSATLVAVALVAGLVPALRAARVNPTAALREE